MKLILGLLFATFSFAATITAFLGETLNDKEDGFFKQSLTPRGWVSVLGVLSLSDKDGAPLQELGHDDIWRAFCLSFAATCKNLSTTICCVQAYSIKLEL